MPDQTRGDDAADHTPKSPDTKASPQEPKPATDKQDAASHANRIDGGRAVPTESINSANDE